MRKAVGITLALLLILGFMRGVVYAVEIPLQVGNAVWYNAQGFLMTPFGPFSSLPFWACFFLSIFVVAVLLKWAFGREQPPTDGGHVGHTPREKDVDLEVLARDLDQMARRMEERVEALETILLDRDRIA